ncbi:S8 family peptidase [Sphingomonas sp. MMS24-J45]|uniref:S8 family peptidase n=1 Tax=Sphingomonas sp. MMS24-J45 TaxID=3238806 RepID=UPI00384C8811
MNRSIRMRRVVGGTIGGRRHLHDVQRRRRKWYRRLHGQVELPRAQQTFADVQWRSQPAPSLRIVILEDAVTPQLELAGPKKIRSMRKDMRRMLHLASERSQMRPYALISARRRSARFPPIGRRPDGPRPETRALYLPAMGIAIVPELSAQEAHALESAGAVVLANELVTIDDPASSGSAVRVPSSAHLDAIDINAARSAGLTGSGVRIGVLDTGIDPSHPEFADTSIEFMAFKTNGERRAIKPKDFDSHGTHVAALCAGKTVGVAPGAELVIAAVMTERNLQGKICGYLAQILAGMDWLAGSGGAGKGVDVVNASLGSPGSASGYFASVEAYRQSGILTIAAIGNSGKLGIGRHSAPGMLDCALGVGAIDNSGRVADFSDWGLCHAVPASSDYKPDMMAPGVDVTSAVPGKSYASKSGTSMACPIVTGSAALLIERDASLRGDPDALTRKLLDLAVPLPRQSAGYDDRRGGRGRLMLTTIAN